jgi:hypothetical protein
MISYKKGISISQRPGIELLVNWISWYNSAIRALDYQGSDKQGSDSAA